jgi:hypothetical protein
VLFAQANGDGVVNHGSQDGGDDIDDIDFMKVIIHTYYCSTDTYTVVRQLCSQALQCRSLPIIYCSVTLANAELTIALSSHSAVLHI